MLTHVSLLVLLQLAKLFVAIQTAPPSVHLSLLPHML
jgi:hypothetical protein